MLNIPKYTQYGGERKIALLDNSTIEFMVGLKNKGYKPEELLLIYDVILLPGWVAEEVKDSVYRTDYVNGLADCGYPIHLIEETMYSDLTGSQEINMYKIVQAAVQRLGEIRGYLRKNVQQDDPLDIEEYSQWIQKLYEEWPIQMAVTSTGRVKKKNAGEVSLTILSEIFSWYYPELETLTIYTQDKDTYEFQRHSSPN